MVPGQLTTAGSRVTTDSPSSVKRRFTLYDPIFFLHHVITIFVQPTLLISTSYFLVWSRSPIVAVLPTRRRPCSCGLKNDRAMVPMVARSGPCHDLNGLLQRPLLVYE
jgi:hypothetical protein